MKPVLVADAAFHLNPILVTMSVLLKILFYSLLLLLLLLWLLVTNVAALHTLSSSCVHYFSISIQGSTSYQIVPLNPKPLLQTLELRF